MHSFRLQTLLRLRQSDRNERRAELAKALRAEAMLMGEQEKIIQQQAEIHERATVLKSPGTADVDALLQAHRYAGLLAAQRRVLEGQLAQVRAECERRRLALVEADRQVQVLEKLRARQEAGHRKQLDREETKQLDELARLGFIYR
jgi:flagellar export protein FliJ